MASSSRFKFTAVRIATLFPMYALGLVVALLIRIGTEKSVPSWYEMGLQGLLLQAWIPWVTEQGIIGTAHLWFVSCLPLYWLAFRPIYRLLRRILPRSAEADLASLRAALRLGRRLRWRLRRLRRRRLRLVSGLGVSCVFLRFTASIGGGNHRIFDRTSSYRPQEPPFMF